MYVLELIYNMCGVYIVCYSIYILLQAIFQYINNYFDTNEKDEEIH